MRWLLTILVLSSTAQATSMVLPNVLAARRIAGEQQILPDDETSAAIAKAARRVSGSFKLCIDSRGIVSRVDRLKSTGFTSYDRKLRREMTKWRYRPYLSRGKAVPVCSVVTFIYSPVPTPPALAPP